MRPFEEEVNDGIEFLNNVQPGWLSQINVKVLDMRSCKYCVAGQCFGDFRNVINTFGLTVDSMRRNGFTCQDSLWKELKTEWVLQIAKLQNPFRFLFG